MRNKLPHSYNGIFACLLLFALTCAAQVAHAANPKIHPASGAIGPATTGTLFSQSWIMSGLGGGPGALTVSSWASDYSAGAYGLTFDTATAKLSGNPDNTVTDYAFTVTAYLSDGSTVSGSYTITINAGGCIFGTGSDGAILFSNFGVDIDPSSPGTIIGTVSPQVQFTCLNGLSYTVAVSEPNPGNLTLTSGSDSMSYALGVLAAGTYTGTGTPIDVFIPSGSAGNSQLLSNYQILPAGTYTNITAIQVTISWGNGANAGQITAALPSGSVRGTIINTCVASPTPGAMTISIDPSSASAQPFSVSQDAAVQCTMGDPIVNIQARSLNGVGNTTCDGPAPGNGIPGMVLKSASGKTISYTFNCNNSTTGAGFGSGLDQNLGIGGFVAQTDAQTADYDNGNQYSDTVTLTVNY